jgi:hypothetical protein
LRYLHSHPSGGIYGYDTKQTYCLSDSVGVKQETQWDPPEEYVPWWGTKERDSIIERGAGAIKSLLEDTMQDLNDRFNAFQQVQQAGEDMCRLMGKLAHILLQIEVFYIR